MGTAREKRSAGRGGETGVDGALVPARSVADAGPAERIPATARALRPPARRDTCKYAEIRSYPEACVRTIFKSP